MKKDQDCNSQQLKDVDYFIHFQFRDPYNNFNRNMVKGKVGKLFKVKDIERHGKALFTITGGRLGNVIVDN